MSNKKPKISIIVPVYNSEKYLTRCVNSILSQSLDDFELLLIDDGSTDKSGLVCDEFARTDQRVKVFHQKNGGASAARNFGLDNCCGDYVSFIDSDDWLEPTYYENFFADDDFSYDIYFQNYILHEANGNVVVKPLKSVSVRAGSTYEAIFYLMKEIKFGWSWIKLFKRPIISDFHLRFDETINLREDELFALQYCRHIKSIYISSKAGYHYYIYGDSLTRRFRDPNEMVRISGLLRSQSLYIKAEGAIDWINQYYLSNLYMSVLQMYVFGYPLKMSREERCKMILRFLTFYKTHSNLDVKYKNGLSKLMYHILWTIGSPSLIDAVMQKWFHVKYAR